MTRFGLTTRLFVVGGVAAVAGLVTAGCSSGPTASNVANTGPAPASHSAPAQPGGSNSGPTNLACRALKSAIQSGTLQGPWSSNPSGSMQDPRSRICAVPGTQIMVAYGADATQQWSTESAIEYTSQASRGTNLWVFEDPQTNPRTRADVVGWAKGQTVLVAVTVSTSNGVPLDQQVSGAEKVLAGLVSRLG